MSLPSQQNAIWIPGWYELDQTLVLGQRQKFWFFDKPPEDSAVVAEAGELLFFNKADGTENCVARFAKIDEMFHPQLGSLLRVDTDGLDYIFFPVQGEEIIVNAEEEPGTLYEGSLQVSDWSVHVKLSEVSQPIADFV